MYSIALIIRKYKLKTKMIYHFIQMKMDKILKAGLHTTFWRVCRATTIFMH